MGKWFSRPNRRGREETRTTAKYQRLLEPNERLSAAVVSSSKDIEYKTNLAPIAEIQESVHTTQSEVDRASSKEHTAMVKSSDKLVISLSTDILHMAEVLLAKEFITEEIHSTMLLSSFTPQMKASILVSAIRNNINIAPHRFRELMKIFSEETSTKDIFKILQSAYQGKKTLLYKSTNFKTKIFYFFNIN